MPTVRTNKGDQDLADLLADSSVPKTANRIAGEVSFVDHKGRTHVLRPTFEAALEIEDSLGMSVQGLHSKFAAAIVPTMAPTTREHGIIIAAGIRAAGEPRVDAEKAARLAYDTGRKALRPALLEFLSALCDGGRGRAEDLGKAVSSNGSRAESELANELIQDLAHHSDATSDSPS